MSGRKSNILSYPIIASGTMTGTTTLTSKVTNIQYLDEVGIQFDWTGSPSGTFQIEVSANYAQDNNSPPNVTNAGTWAPLTFTYWNGSAMITATSIPTSVGSPIYLDLALLSAPWIRAQYTNSASTGVLTAVITAKEL